MRREPDASRPNQRSTGRPAGIGVCAGRAIPPCSQWAAARLAAGLCPAGAGHDGGHHVARAFSFSTSRPRLRAHLAAGSDCGSSLVAQIACRRLARLERCGMDGPGRGRTAAGVSGRVHEGGRGCARGPAAALRVGSRSAVRVALAGASPCTHGLAGTAPGFVCPHIPRRRPQCCDRCGGAFCTAPLPPQR